MNKITINDTKNIKHLEFTFPTVNGVYLLVGTNGAGKTTLLICMDRLCNSLAFATGFTNTSSWEKADQFKNSSIRYDIDNSSVQFRKRRARWAPTPKTGSGELLEKFGFSESVFIRADSKRIDVKSDDLRSGNLEAADQSVKTVLNELFETEKYEKLMRLRNPNGRGRQATYFYVIKEGSMYYSEKRFSTGELALVRLVERIESVNDNALILLDEAELALHPRIQVNLLNYLKKRASEKHLSVFVSTHSPTMIKAVAKENIFLLKQNMNGNVNVITPCYPATAIGDIDFENSTAFDYIFFVEDDMARDVLRSLRNRYIGIEPKFATAICTYIPVGGFAQTAEMAVNTQRRVFAQSKVFAMVDQDAFDNMEDKPVFSELYNRYPQMIRGLSFTPENWLIGYIESNNIALNQKIRDEYRIEVPNILKDRKYRACNSTKPRQLAKDKFDVVIEILSETSGNNIEVVKNSLIQTIVSIVPEGVIKGIFNPIFKME